MNQPTFVADVPKILMRDPLAQFLGAAEDGVIEYSYADAVKLTGHSCPTVAGAYLMTLKALAYLYPDALPERGAIKVELREAVHTGVTGVIASVVGLITGAAAEGGFKGLGGRFVRKGLLSYGAPVDGTLRCTRTDTGRHVTASYDGARVPAPPALRALLGKSPMTEAEHGEFARLWQERIKRILIDHFDDPELVLLR